MLDLLFALGQFLSVIALLYGLILTVAHHDCIDEMRSSYDPITGHDWLPIRAQPSRHSVQADAEACAPYPREPIAAEQCG
jgi:hypothetical protein